MSAANTSLYLFSCPLISALHDSSHPGLSASAGGLAGKPAGGAEEIDDGIEHRSRPATVQSSWTPCASAQAKFAASLMLPCPV